jgi:hypothetical protein
MNKSILKVRANYNSWKHPIRWILGWKKRKLLDEIINYEWNNGLEKEFDRCLKELMIEGKTQIGDKTLYYEIQNKRLR